MILKTPNYLNSLCVIKKPVAKVFAIKFVSALKYSSALKHKTARKNITIICTSKARKLQTFLYILYTGTNYAHNMYCSICFVGTLTIITV